MNMAVPIVRSGRPRGAVYVPPATRFIELPGDYGSGDFIMRRGGALPRVHIAYECWGELAPNKGNAILLFTGLSPTAHACSSQQDPRPGWWESMIGPGKSIDTERFFLVCVNSLGGCFGSTGPMALNPNTQQEYRLDFPELTVEDIAKAGHHAMHELGIDHLRAVVGASMGGMSALAYAMQYADEMDDLVSISAAPRALPFSIAMRSLQREAIRSDPAWNEGCYRYDEEPLAGMLLARKLGIMSYRAAEEWRRRFNRARVPRERRPQSPFAIEFEVESYLDYNARKFIGRFDANTYLYLSRAMDLFDVADHGGTVNAGLSRIHARRTLIVGVESDILFPIDQQHQIAEGLHKAGCKVEFVALDSLNGHDSFLVDIDHFAPVMARFFAEG
jgi:homoserine O-acetyltransferase